ncbi:transferrin-binding protein-like solute binding protein [Psychrobacter sp. I-STPA6b]|uniref:transferrin-binding protein-like solute binding protein n=1 Tax=Psychrobacter sp. I-STPA6b TaxID=2585718 RepID=UPI001D0CA1C3|nr:transferrin-binding protein-like solute binding protein [Psychrobacter sp. I-STPA6b]
MFSTKQRLICIAVFAAMTTACSTGSGLNTGSTNPTTNIPGNGGTETPKEKFKKVDLAKSTVADFNKKSEDDSAEPAPEPEYGYSIASPFTGGPTLYGMTDEQKATNASINTSAAKTNTNADDYNTLTYVNSPEQNSDGATKKVTITKEGFTNDAYNYHPEAETADRNITINDNIKDDNMVLVINSDNFETLKMVEFDHTKAGAVFNGQDPKYANIFYRGKDASELLPSSGTAEYNGLWEVVRKVEINPGEAIAGYGGNSFNSRAPADFTVNFADKTIRGNLDKNYAKGRAFAYGLKGNITGNTFTATATSTDKATNEDIATVTGGFFGKQGAELAGKLISENAAGVFAAKQTDSTGIKEGEPVPEVNYNKSGSIDFNKNSEFVTNFEEVLASTTKLPNVNSINLNGVEIDLLTQTDNVFTDKDKNLPLQFTRIGTVQTNTDKENPLYTYFYQGQLTQAMPTGEAKYEGNWIASGKAENGTPYSISKASNAQLNFTANFAEKTLTGQFLTPDGNKAMTLNKVDIQGNTFAGTANIIAGGLTNDKDGTQGRIKGSVDLSGGFFGDNANELGGQFSKEDNSFAGVFAGKKTK